MPDVYIRISPITTFVCDRCGKIKKNAHLHICPSCHNKYCGLCWEKHLEREHNDRERNQAIMEIL